jgi:hypothetical protein
VCYLLTELSVIRHALAANAEFILTVNHGAPGASIDRKQYQAVSGRGPGEFLNVPGGGAITEEAHSRLIGVAPVSDSA